MAQDAVILSKRDIARIQKHVGKLAQFAAGLGSANGGAPVRRRRRRRAKAAASSAVVSATTVAAKPAVARRAARVEKVFAPGPLSASDE